MDVASGHARGPAPFDRRTVVRPDRSLLTYYIICALLTGPFSPFVFLPLFFKYETLTYRFEDDGVAMSWGILFRREIYLTYRRIQDIHVTRNILQRWMGLATVAVQTASTTGAEMHVDGVLEYDQLRDFLYQRMRGARGQDDTPGSDEAALEHVGGRVRAPVDPALALLEDIRDSLRTLANRKADRP
jgi:uncharacterized membrane protein YdbT with pleckstrin-like domain